MKKILFSFLAMSLLCSVSFANCCEDNTKAPFDRCKNEQEQPQKCDKCTLEDDEYCVYNECFFDKQYRKMKTALCLTKQQENCIDNIYRNFKSDMETSSARYRVEKNKLLEMIECNNDCYKDQIKHLKNLRKDNKEKIKDFRDDVKEQLCGSQRSEFRKFQREQKRKMKKIVKYGAIYKLPCVDCCK